MAIHGSHKIASILHSWWWQSGTNNPEFRHRKCKINAITTGT